MSIEIIISNQVSVSRHGGVTLSCLNGGPWMGNYACIGFIEDSQYRDAFIELFAREVGVDPDILSADIEKAVWVQKLEIVEDDWCGGRGPLADEGPGVTYERLLEILDEQDRAEATANAKVAHTAIRRAEFNRVRSDIVLAMIDAGAPYQCSHPGCKSRSNLTVDHIKPLSRGGSDQLSNLQFMCQPHNSQKGAR